MAMDFIKWAPPTHHYSTELKYDVKTEPYNAGTIEMSNAIWEELDSIGKKHPFEDLVKEIVKQERKRENEMITKNSYICINGIKYRLDELEVDQYSKDCDSIACAKFRIGSSTTIPDKDTPKVQVTKYTVEIPEIKNVIFNYPATIVFWSDGTKTIVKCMEGEEWDPQDGINAAIAKKIYGNEARKWVKKGQYEKVPTYDTFTVNVSPNASSKEIAEGVKKALKKVRELKNAL